MAGKKCSASLNRWFQEHFSDKYVQQTQKRGSRSRARFKLDEMRQGDEIFKSGMTVVDLGAAPDGWSQHTVTQIGNSGRITACDLLSMDPIIGADFLQGDFRDELVLKALLERVGNSKAQVVMSDMAPNVCGTPAVDIPRAIYLVELALEISRDVLAPGGSLVVKVFRGEGFGEYLREIRSLSAKVKARKPDSSRARSREVYIVAARRKPQPVDSKRKFERDWIQSILTLFLTQL